MRTTNAREPGQMSPVVHLTVTAVGRSGRGRDWIRVLRSKVVEGAEAAWTSHRWNYLAIERPV
jgi:hypothetical protein